MKNLTLGIISNHDAQWLGMAASVAGGWVMVGAAWMNCSRLTDALGLGLSGGLLAALPDSIRTVAIRPVDAAKCAQILRDDIARNEARNYCRGSKDEDVAMLRTWLARIEALLEVA